MKYFIGILTLVLALAISAVAAYFSVAGLAAIFAATAGAVVVMGVTLEAGKLASAAWLHANWRNPKVNFLHRAYMVAAVVALMLITALGIYGFLAKGHLEQSTPLAPVELQIGTKQAELDAINADLKSQKDRLGQLDAAVNSMIGGDKAVQGLRFRGHQTAERAEIQQAIAADNAKAQTITKDLVPLKLQVNEVETKLGPIKYVAAGLGLKDTESAVRIVILTIMFAFDPLAIVLVLSSTITISDGAEDRRAKGGAPDRRTGQRIMDDPTLQKSQYDHGNLLQELEEVVAPTPEPVTNAAMTDKEQLLDILERKPDLLQNIVEAIQDQHAKQDGRNESWLHSGPAK